MRPCVLWMLNCKQKICRRTFFDSVYWKYRRICASPYWRCIFANYRSSFLRSLCLFYYNDQRKHKMNALSYSSWRHWTVRIYTLPFVCVLNGRYCLKINLNRGYTKSRFSNKFVAIFWKRHCKAANNRTHSHYRTVIRLKVINNSIVSHCQKPEGYHTGCDYEWKIHASLPTAVFELRDRTIFLCNVRIYFFTCTIGLVFS